MCSALPPILVGEVSKRSFDGGVVKCKIEKNHIIVNGSSKIADPYNGILRSLRVTLKGDGTKDDRFVLLKNQNTEFLLGVFLYIV